MQNLLIPSFFIAFFLIIFYLVYRVTCRFYLLNKYKNVIELFEYFCKKAYTIIYNDQIIGYTVNNIKGIPHDEFETIQRNFIKLTLELMGKNNINMFIQFFGDNKNFVSNLIFYMKDQFTHDQLLDIVQKSSTLKEK